MIYIIVRDNPKLAIIAMENELGHEKNSLNCKKVEKKLEDNVNYIALLFSTDLSYFPANIEKN